MKDTWDELFVNLDNYATIMKEFIAMVPHSLTLHKEIKKLEKIWRRIQTNVNKFEKEFNPAKPIIINIPDEFNRDDFLIAWQEWKDYLAEQHNEIMLTRSETNALELLLEESEGNVKEAIYMLKYASGHRYTKFFKVNKNEISNLKPGNDGKSGNSEFDEH